MSPLQMFLPASEPARSEALAALQRSHHLPRHLVRGIARGAGAKRALAASASTEQMEQEIAAPDEASGGHPQFG
ncbi:MAG TPA: hypothetical protein VGI11_19700 [Variovorax sp.]|jgi:hypothetical protein